VGDLSRDFNAQEFTCPCCGKVDMDPDFINRLQAVRTALRVPFKPVDGGGYRCTQYNETHYSAHTEGKAIDPNLSPVHYPRFIQLALAYGFTGIGVKNAKGQYQLHADTALSIPNVRHRPAVWTYDTHE